MVITVAMVVIMATITTPDMEAIFRDLNPIPLSGNLRNGDLSVFQGVPSNTLIGA
jgi:hypothetical protein